MTTTTERKPLDINSLMGDILEERDKAVHDLTGQGIRQVRVQGGPVHLHDSASPTPGPYDDQPVSSATQPVEEDAINPSHYRRHPSGIECIEITRHLNFNVGNAIKYLWRHMDKGDPVENLKKAQWYIDDEIRRLQGLR